MYEIGKLAPFRLKTTNGNVIAYYGNCNINITGSRFDNIKNRNKSDTPFMLNPPKNFNANNITKLSTTTHILALQTGIIFGVSFDTIQLTAPPNFNPTEIQMIPDLNDQANVTALNNFILSIKNSNIKKTLQLLSYNITHGNTPYSNIDYRNKPICNTFVYHYDDSDSIFNMKTEHYPTGSNNYPQNAIIFLAQDYVDSTPHVERPFFLYQKNTYCKYFDNNTQFTTMPSYGLTVSNYNLMYFYWTTYKGV